MTITLIEIKNYKIYCQFYLSIFSIAGEENERCLLSFWKDGYRYQMDLFFIHLIKIGY